ncbi:MAG: hypothetical protein VW405_02810 [Rhodospirillaceae bacterium]
MSLTLGHAESPHEFLAPAGLREIWVRSPGDLLHPSVPLRTYKTGDARMVQTPPGCELYCNPLIEAGTAWLVFDGGYMWAANGRLIISGDVREVKGRKRSGFLDMGRKTVVLTKVPDLGAA